MQIMSVCYREKIAISERLLSRAKLQIVSVCCRDKMQIRSNQSLVDMKARNNKELKETTELNKLNEPNDYMNPKSY